MKDISEFSTYLNVTEIISSCAKISSAQIQQGVHPKFSHPNKNLLNLNKFFISLFFLLFIYFLLRYEFKDKRFFKYNNLLIYQ